VAHLYEKDRSECRGFDYMIIYPPSGCRIIRIENFSQNQLFDNLSSKDNTNSYCNDMRNTFKAFATTTLAILIFSITAFTQNFKYKVGDKVEAQYKGKWYEGIVTGYYAQMYTVKVEALGLTLYPEENETRSINNSNQHTGNTNTERGKTAEQNTPTTQAPCDWSAWGILGKKEFMDFATATTGRFATNTADLLCIVRTRKVNFRLTNEEMASVNAWRKSPELIQVLNESYKSDKPIEQVKATSVKAGRYACGPGYRPDLFIITSNKYTTANKTDPKGDFLFSSATNRITWSTGPLSGGTMTGEFDPKYSSITIYNTRNQILFSCSWAEK